MKGDAAPMNRQRGSGCGADWGATSTPAAEAPAVTTQKPSVRLGPSPSPHKATGSSESLAQDWGPASPSCLNKF